MRHDEIAGLPKAVLHDHLDGALRVETVLELADEVGHLLPATDVDGLRRWFHQGESGSLERYLASFEHTIAVMQTADGVRRVAYEAAVDLAADGAVYAEVRFDPGLSTRRGLDRFDVLEAALDGLDAAAAETGLRCGLIVTALRHGSDSEDAAEAAIRFRTSGVVGFDLAGPEAGYPPDRHLPAIGMARRAGLGITIHAGEGDGPHSIWRAVALCGAQRIGHGARIAEDTDFDGVRITRLGDVARRIRDHRIPLEIAVTSNVHTGMVRSPQVHPLGALHRAGFTVSINTDNRLMSGVTLADEYELAATAFGLTRADLRTMTVRAIEGGFGDWEERRRIIATVVEPAYQEPTGEGNPVAAR